CPPYGKLRRWDAHYAAIAVQGAAWQRLRRQHMDCALCVAGDFHQMRQGRLSYGTKWGRHLLDQALAWASLKDTTTPSFYALDTVDSEGWSLPDGVQPIDHICLSNKWAKQVAAVGAWCGKPDSGYLSDH